MQKLSARRQNQVGKKMGLRNVALMFGVTVEKSAELKVLLIKSTVVP